MTQLRKICVCGCVSCCCDACGTESKINSLIKHKALVLIIHLKCAKLKK